MFKTFNILISSHHFQTYRMATIFSDYLWNENFIIIIYIFQLEVKKSFAGNFEAGLRIHVVYEAEFYWLNKIDFFNQTFLSFITVNYQILGRIQDLCKSLIFLDLDSEKSYGSNWIGVRNPDFEVLTINDTLDLTYDSFWRFFFWFLTLTTIHSTFIFVLSVRKQPAVLSLSVHLSVQPCHTIFLRKNGHRTAGLELSKLLSLWARQGRQGAAVDSWP